MIIFIAALFNCLLTLIVLYLLTIDYFFAAVGIWGIGSYVLFSLGVVAGYYQRQRESTYEKDSTQ